MQNVNLRFRPSLVVFVDQAGKEICEQLKGIIQLTEFEDVLHQSIALIQVTTSEPDQANQAFAKPPVSFEQAVPIPVGAEFPPDDNDIPTEPADLGELIAASLTSIQLDKRLIEIGANYPVPETRPQIYIVGNARSEALRGVHKMIQVELRRRYFSTEVCYVLDAYEAARAGIVVEDDLVPARPDDPYWLGEDVPHFCFFYEEYLAYPQIRTVTRRESHYAAAESLFALIATGITPEPRFADFTHSPARLTSYANVGSMNTALVIFPRNEALTYSSARLGCDLVKQWLDDLNRELLPEKIHRSLQDRARRDVTTIEEWIKDTELRPAANEDVREVLRQHRRYRREMIENERGLNRWPTLDILREDSSAVRDRARTQQQGLLRDVEDQTVALFELFRSDDVEREVRRYRRRPETWIRLVDQRGQRAVEAHSEWSQSATNAWEAASSRVQTDVRHEVDTLWSDRRNGVLGFEMARIYVDTFDDGLVKLQERLINLRVAHQRNYMESLDHFGHLSEGDWLRQPGAQNDQAGGAIPAQARPTMGSRGAAPPGAANTGGAGGSPGAGGIGGTGAATHRHLSQREEQIVDQLERRILWWQDQVPSIPTQLAISLPFLLALALASQALYPQGTALAIAAITLGVALIIGLANWLFWRRYWKKVKEAKKDLLHFYCRIFAYRSETSEDSLRLLVMTPLRRRVMAMRERLDSISDFLNSVQTRLDESSRRVQRDLFNTPSGARDIYVVNGERLQKRNKNTLEDLAAQVTHQREHRPLEPWHQTLREMKERLIEAFRQQSIIEMSEDAAWQQIDTFTRDVTQGYLHGQLDNIQRALENTAIWSEARERACSPLYQALVGYRKPELFFVCGRPAILMPLHGAQTGTLTLNRSSVSGKPKWPADAIPVSISDHHNWVLFAAFFKGGTPPALDPDILFPPKHKISLSDDSQSKLHAATPDDPQVIAHAPASEPLNGLVNPPNEDEDEAPLGGMPGPAPDPNEDEDDDYTPPRGIPRPMLVPDFGNDDESLPRGTPEPTPVPTPAPKEDEDASPPNLSVRQKELFKIIQRGIRDPNRLNIPDSEQK